MRSRFAAYALGHTDYIMATTDPSGPQFQADAVAWVADIERFSTRTRFRGLTILDALSTLHIAKVVRTFVHTHGA